VHVAYACAPAAVLAVVAVTPVLVVVVVTLCVSVADVGNSISSSRRSSISFSRFNCSGLTGLKRPCILSNAIRRCCTHNTAMIKL
jgi:hypothetical protein